MSEKAFKVFEVWPPELEDKLNARREALGRDAVFFSSRAIPLAQLAGTHDQLGLFEDATCDIAGYCHI